MKSPAYYGPGYYRLSMKENSLLPLSAYSLLVVNPEGYIREVFCPFRVFCISTVETIPLGTWVYVDKLAMTAKAQLVYFINKRWYSYHSFAIVIKF